MIKKDILKQIEIKIKDLNKKNLKITLDFCFNVYSINIWYYIKSFDSSFNKDILEIQFKNKSNSINMFNLIKNKYKDINYFNALN